MKYPLANFEDFSFQKINSYSSIIFILILATGIQIAYWVQFQTSDFGSILLVDADGYHLKALKILNNGWLGDSVFYQAPLYPYFLALVYKILGQNILIVQGVQIVLSIITLWLIFKIGESLFSREIGVLSAGLGAIYGPFIFYSVLILKVTLSLFFSCLFILTLLRSCESFKKTVFFSGGILLGVNITLRGNYLLLYPITALWILFAFPNLKAKQKLINFCVFSLGMAFCVFPITLRNYILADDLVLTSYQAGANFYIGNNPNAKGNYTNLKFVRANPKFEEEDFRRKAEATEGRVLKASEVSQFWFKKTLSFINDHPIKFIRLLSKKSLLFFNNYEIPDNYDYQFLKTLNPVLSIGIVSFGPVFLSAIFGIIFFRWVGPKFYLMYGFIIIYSISVVLFFVTSRYRMPIVPILLPFSASFILEGLNQIKNTNRKNLAFFGAILLVPTLMAFKPISLINFSFSYINMGIAYEEKKNFKKALQLYQQAEKVEPGDFKAMHHMGIIFSKTGKNSKSKEAFLKSLARNPNFAEAHFSLAEFYKKNGQIADAIKSYKVGLRISPENHHSHFNLAELYRVSGHNDNAIKENIIAIRLKPEFAEAHFNLGGLYLMKKSYKNAKFHYSQAKKLGLKVPKVNLNQLSSLKANKS